MATFLLRRLLLAVFVLLAVSSVTFFALRLNGDPITESLQASGASAAEISAIRHEMGYDRPIAMQYADFLAHLARGDFGDSLRYGQPAVQLIGERLGYTLELAGVALLLTLVVAIPLGILSAVRHGTVVDRLTIVLAAVGQAVPNFVVGPLLILLFGVVLGWLPVSGAEEPTALILPAVTLALYPLARVARLLRVSMIDVAGNDYVTTARAKGVAEWAVVVRHVFRNALLPVLTIVGLQIVAMLGGAVVVETVFGWPGLGTLAKDALLTSDFPLVQAIVVLIAAGVVVVNLATDIVYSVADPRIRRR
ncbi:ABC transporter permease [Streptosporangium sp. NPDC051022]|uniref:ABC transporter permease n=1 Tax=Streptosporangium sp. NPDC051022 TaxID=3155752 RepID=UPI00343E9E51